MQCYSIRHLLRTCRRGLLTWRPSYSALKKFADRPGVMQALYGMLAALAERWPRCPPRRRLNQRWTLLGSGPAARRRTSSAVRAGEEQIVKVSVLILCGSLIPASMVVSWEPGNDKVQAGELIDRASQSVRRTSCTRSGFGSVVSIGV